MSQPITITVKYFASIREAIGVSSEALTAPAHTVAALRSLLASKGEPYATALADGKSIRTAYNQVMCDAAISLENGCEVAFFPPVTGG